MFEDFIFRVVGRPPTAEATREERLLWIRRFYRLNVITIPIAIVAALVTGSSLVWIVAAVIAVWWVVGIASISRSIRRARIRPGS